MIVSLRHFFGWLVSAFSSREDLRFSVMLGGPYGPTAICW